ncbi:MAG: hypothetical protein IAF02_05045 [Anaerolineae bacterium]|nr:hypothetical protein [Anaerolineae bacterium]
MKQTFNFWLAGFAAVGDNGRFPQPNNVRDERIEELRRKRTLWSRLC